MKIQICRASGLPVKFEDIQAYNEAHRQLYDKVANHVLGENRLMTQEEANRMNKLLTRLVERTLPKFKTVDTIDVSGTKKSWLDLVAQHGPIALAKNSETNQLAAIIMDAPWEM